MEDTHIKNEIRERVSSYFTDFITYELNGSDFISWVNSILPKDFEGEVVGIPNTIELNDELLNSIVGQITEHVYSGVKVNEYKITEQPMKFIRVEIGDIFYDVFLPDLDDLSSIVMITDQEGERLDYKKWDYITEVLRKSL
jgi:hypothetical protein